MSLIANNHYKKLRKNGYNIGAHTYVGKHARLCPPDKIIIGDYCCIGNDTLFNPSQHPTNWLSVHPFQYRNTMDPLLYGKFPPNDTYMKFNEQPKSIEMGNDVWIGERAVVMGGVKIGDGAIVALGAIVTKDVPPYSIVAGVPAKVVKYRFTRDIIDNLLEVKWWTLPYEFIQKLPFDNINQCIRIIKEYRQNSL